ncbi:MAG: flippase-like domain-containing protein [Actinobacteria bacterium]|nr:flippase-like domain-containing protein [Actinomycetota bacterium]MCA1721934.1 flippase-like domain-containing protein [Actinomycetota bacterium]
MPPRTPFLLAAAGIGLAVTTARLHLSAAGLVQTALGSALLVASSAAALNASRVRALPASRAVPAVLACTAANAVTPAGLGGSALMVRLHTRTGLSGDEAFAAVTLRALASGLAGIVVASVAAATLGLDGPSLPGGSTGPLVLAALLAGAVVLAFACPHRRSRAADHARRTAAAVGTVLSRPWRAAALLLGGIGVVAAQLLILDGAVRAVGGDVGVGALLVTLLGSSAARAAVPSPGGIGPVEAALVAGLAALGIPMAAAAVAVGVYRTAGLWLPVLCGVLALRRLRVLGLL